MIVHGRGKRTQRVRRGLDYGRVGAGRYADSLSGRIRDPYQGLQQADEHVHGNHHGLPQQLMDVNAGVDWKRAGPKGDHRMLGDDVDGRECHESRFLGVL